jgi:hypothetical protein
MKQMIKEPLTAGEIEKLVTAKEANITFLAHRGRSKTLRQAILWGVFSVGAYLLIFLNQEAITQYFTKGGIFALAVIITPLVFSIIHGSFASYVLEILGIRPLRQDKD